jgi:hypothetical protein
MKKKPVTCPSVAGLCALTIAFVLAATGFLLYHQDQAFVAGVLQREEIFAQHVASARGLLQEGPAATQQMLDRPFLDPYLAAIEVADGKGRIIAATNRAMIGQLFEGPDWNSAKSGRIPSVFPISSERGEQVSVVFAPVSDGPHLAAWSRTTVVIPFKERLESAIRTVGVMLVLLVVMLAGMFWHHARMRAAVDDIQEQVRTIVRQATGLKDEAA